jgi:hypothetical protein
MQLMDAMRQAQNGKAIDNVARTFGIKSTEAEAVIAALIPQVGRVIERNTLSRGGIADVVTALGDPRYRSALETPDLLKTPQMQSAGIELLERLVGNKDKSRALAAHAAASSGLSEVLIKQLLPYLLPMIIGAIAKSGGGALNDILGKLEGSGGSGTSIPAPTTPYQPSQRSGGGPLPLPGSHTPLGGGSNPYSDLSDTIRTGGGAAGGIPGLIRSVLGGLLGFQSRGVISWLIRLVVMRWGWSLLKLFLGRLLGGR